MNILLVGNGFDLAHGLPTDYMSFVKFLNIVQSGITWKENYKTIQEDIKQFSICSEFDSFFFDYFSPQPNKKSAYINEVRDLMQNNFWTTYFLPAAKWENTWINFESEISEIVQSLDRYRNSADGRERFHELSKIVAIFERLGVTRDEVTAKNFKELRDRVLDDLDRLTRCLEIYLCLCAKIVPVNKKLLSVLMIGRIDGILSFNYTDTFQRVYKLSCDRPPEVCYIHGRANINGSVTSNNMVLGIDEYLHEPKRSKDVTFLRFKKYYQRIYKQTDYNYMEWLRRSGEKNLYIIGHSLDMTDGDVLLDMLTCPGMTTTIFYHTKDANALQISNLVQVLGYDVLNNLTRGREDTSITFRPLACKE